MMPMARRRPPGPVLIVGHGLIGGSVRGLLLADQVPVVSVGRRRLELPGYLAYDLTSEAARAGLQAAVAELRPACVVLAHGPSDVTWIEENAADAAAVHGGVADIVARSGVPAILISTDNVFSGTRGGYRPADPVEPCNVYGRVKARAEEALLAGGRALVLRVSLVYGWTGPEQRSTFAERCLAAAAQDRPMSAPTDQVFTPVHARDVATVVAAQCKSALCKSALSRSALSRSAGPVTGIQHLAGPTELSRYEFARLAYGLADADPALVRPCLRQDTEWACRPAFSALACGDFTSLPGVEHWQPMTPAEGLRAMLAARPPGLAARPPGPAGAAPAGPSPAPAGRVPQQSGGPR